MNDQEQSDIEVITSNQLARADEVLPGIIHLLPVAARPFFPGQAVPLLMHAEAWTPTIDAIAKSPHDLVGVVLTENDKSELATPGDMYRIGTVGRIHRAQMVDRKLQILIECLQRFRIEKFHTDRPPFTASVSYIKEFSGRPDDDIKAYAMAIINTIKELLPLNPLYQEELRMFLDRFGPDDPSHLADFAASLTTSDKDALQGVLETFDLLRRIGAVGVGKISRHRPGCVAVVGFQGHRRGGKGSRRCRSRRRRRRCRRTQRGRSRPRSGTRRGRSSGRGRRCRRTPASRGSRRRR